MEEQSSKLRVRNVILVFITVFALGLSTFLVVQNIQLRSNIDMAKEQALSERHKQILDFNAEFINLVLKQDQEIGFEDRLRLENNVRELDDQEILDVWIAFTNSNTNGEAQDNTVALLEILVKKLRQY